MSRGHGLGKCVRVRQDKLETHHLTCMVCGALPDTTCIDEDQARAQIHPSRRMSIAERNWRSGHGWEPPEMVKRRRKRRAEEAARAALFDPTLGPGAVAARKGRGVKGQAAS